METAMSYETILVEQQGAVTLITLNRPQALNALNTQVLADLIDAFAVHAIAGQIGRDRGSPVQQHVIAREFGRQRIGRWRRLISKS